MYEFCLSAFPLVIIGICIALICANKDKVKNKETYLLEGMCLGMCLGIAVSTSLHFELGLGISLGMLVGETIGLLIEKK